MLCFPCPTLLLRSQQPSIFHFPASEIRSAHTHRALMSVYVLLYMSWNERCIIRHRPSKKFLKNILSICAVILEYSEKCTPNFKEDYTSEASVSTSRLAVFNVSTLMDAK